MVTETFSAQLVAASVINVKVSGSTLPLSQFSTV